MQVDDLNVFDLDGTILYINSFREISKRLVGILLKEKKLFAVFNITVFYFIRKIGLITHLKFKRYIVDVFEKNLTENQKTEIIHSVWQDNINEEVLAIMLNADNCILSTSAPFSFVKRMPLRDDLVVISSLDNTKQFPDPSNFGSGKLENLKYYFNEQTVNISNIYTDSTDDQSLIDFSINAFMVKRQCVGKIK